MRVALIIVGLAALIAVSSRTASADQPITYFKTIGDVPTCADTIRADPGTGPASAVINLTALCASQFSKGLLLFSWICNSCGNDPSYWLWHFIVNGTQTSRFDIHAYPRINHFFAWTVRANQFRAGDCVAVAVTDELGGNTYRSVNICLRSLAPNAFSNPSVSEQPVYTHPNGGGAAVAATPLPPSINISAAKAAGVATTSYYKVAAPTNLRTTTNPQDCPPGPLGLQAVVCAQGIRNGNVILLWDWTPGNGTSDIDGYNVYNANSHSRVKQMQSPDLRLYITYNNPVCYMIRAYKGSSESAPSNSLCISGAAIGPQTITLAPTANSYESTRYGYTSYLGTSSGTNSTEASQIHVGFSYLTQKHTTGDWFFNTYWRAAFSFDLRPLAGKPIYKATLHLHVQNTEMGVPAQAYSAVSCSTQIGTGTPAVNPFVATMDFGEFFDDLGHDGPDISVDVTQQVIRWTQGAPNLGFVLRGADENLEAFTEERCDSHYSASLEVQH